MSLRTNPDKPEKFPKLYAYVLTDHTLLSPLHFHPRTHEQVGRASPYHNRNKSIRGSSSRISHAKQSDQKDLLFVG